MTYEEAIDFILNKIQIDVRFCSEFDISKTETALDLAVSALEKQIPNRPIKRTFLIGCKEAKPLNCCPTCKEPNNDDCCDCGQRIDWSNDTRDHGATDLAETMLTSEDFICSRCGASTNDMNALSKPINYCFNCGARIKRVRSDAEWKL